MLGPSSKVRYIVLPAGNVFDLPLMEGESSEKDFTGVIQFNNTYKVHSMTNRKCLIFILNPPILFLWLVCALIIFL
ncbi:hypothetical protein CLOSBL3_12084 [Clostridiaceae bacterium BL-3]|nr:hypothetical protein CLOSBL3_12084 [Clostridiaceae bacterium BL-3]